MIKQSIRNLYRSELDEELKEYGAQSREDVLDYLFGDYENDYSSRYLVKHMYKPSTNTLINRVNTFWVYPLFIILAPFRYLLYGSAQIAEDGKLGRILIRLIGELR